MTHGACLKRLQRELAHIAADGVSPTVYVAPCGDDLTTLDALVIGPPGTPYDCAMFHFRLTMTDQYPHSPPRVKVVSTDSGTLRAHPQLYSDGKVCLSILGTWHGPKWSAGISLRTLLLSIQSLLSEEPLRCEPGLEEASKQAVDRANVFWVHEAARALVLGQLLNGPTWGSGEDVAPLTEAMHRHLAQHSQPLLKRLKDHAAKFDGQPARDPLTPGAGVNRYYDFAGLHAKLERALGEAGLLSAAPPLAPAAAADCADGQLAPRLDAAASAMRPAAAAAAASGAEDGDGASPRERRDASSRAATSAAVPKELDDEADEPHCRICHMTEEESGEPLIVPCACCGSIRYAHSHCLLDWLRHTHATSGATWRCDICRTPFVVKLGRRRRRGYGYLVRDVDVLADPDFDAPGSVCVLVITFVQLMLMALARTIAKIGMQPAFFLHVVLPEVLGGVAFATLAIPAALVDILAILGYGVLAFAKLAILVSGPHWTPSRWGGFGEAMEDGLFNTVADFMTYPLGCKLDTFVWSCSWFTLGTLSSLMSGHLLWRLVAQLSRPWLQPHFPDFFAVDERPLFEQSFHGAPAVLPAGISQAFGTLYLVFAWISVIVNVAALLDILVRAFWISIPEPSDILPASMGRGRGALGKQPETESWTK